MEAKSNIVFLSETERRRFAALLVERFPWLAKGEEYGSNTDYHLRNLYDELTGERKQKGAKR